MFLTFHDNLEDGHKDDCIFLRNLHLSAIVGEDAWGREGKIQPVIVSLQLRKNIYAAGQSDNINDTVSYGQMCKEIMEVVEVQNKLGGFGSMDNLCNSIKELAVQWGGTAIYIRVLLPKASLHASGGIGLELIRSLPLHPKQVTMSYLVNDLKLSCIIGVNAHEHLTKQVVIVNLQLASTQYRLDYKRLTEDVTKVR
jgi:dihydroneopterin aldolase/2-amino-4-hydroxy-6-hydroxymethyldihydropteridine diphosphokinase/dihydropteroate synthase